MHGTSLKYGATYNWGDYKIVFGHVTRSFGAKEDNMKKHSTIVKSLVNEFPTTWLEKIDRNDNEKQMNYPR